MYRVSRFNLASSIRIHRSEVTTPGSPREERAIGILKGHLFLDGNTHFLAMTEQRGFPFALEEILSEEALKQVLKVLSQTRFPLFLDLRHGDILLSATLFPLARRPDTSIWLISKVATQPFGKPIVGLAQRYQHLFENIKDAVFVSTVEGQFLDINPAGVEMLGYASREEVLKLNILTDLYYYPEDRLKYQKTIAEKGYVKDYEVVFKKKDKTPLFVAMSNVAVYDEDRKVLGYEGIFRNLTHQKQIEEELRQKNTQLESYVYTVSHDLKSPVIAIQGFARLLQRRYGEKLGVDGLEIADRIEKTARRAERMIADLLVYAKAEKDARGDFEFIETARVIREIIEELNLKWQLHSVTFTVRDDLPEILFHPGSFRQIFSNLIDNAIKYSQNTPAPRIVIDYRIEPDGIVFSVADNGPGIDPALHERIFDIFERGEESGEMEGTGLGLAIIKRIVETHHGNIWVESEKGKGATFYVRLPVRTLTRG